MTKNSASGIGTDVGSEVRQLRKARGLTLKALSQASEISLSHLSAIERGASNPSVDMLNTIAETLGVTPAWFFVNRKGDGPMERAHIVRAQHRRDLNVLYGQSKQELGYQDMLLSSSIGGNFYMGLATYEPNSVATGNTMQQHEGEQHGLVVDGTLEMRIHDEVITLNEGDSYSFPANIPHHVFNRTNAPAKLVWAVTPVVIPSQIARGKTADNTTD